MKEIRYFYVPNASICDELPLEEATHAIRVLRMQQGDGMVLMDGNGFFHEAVITMITNKRCFYEITLSVEQKRQWQRRIHIAVAPTKMIERMEWFVEKAIEIGVDEITFLSCDYSERKKIRIDRIEKIAVAAMKQSRKAWLPVINEMTDFKHFVSQQTEVRKYICHCYNEYEKISIREALFADKDMSPLLILIGPEGDFSIREVEHAQSEGYKSATLGSSRLRTETAALYAVSMAHII